MSLSFRAAFLASILVAGPQAAATVADDAQQLIQQDRADQALKLLDAHLAEHAQDAEARFARGLALVRLNRSREAISTFADLTRDFPQLPEPYNNLAVLYAAEGNHAKAREALETALANNPGYATAHENLGDIYAAMAAAAYDQALQLEPGNGTVQRKLNGLRQVEGIAAAPASPAPRPALVAPPRTAAAAVPPPAAAPSIAPPTPATDESVAATESALQNWARAWSAKDLDGYFGAYAADFVPEDGQDRATWQAQRRDRIQAANRIGVRVSGASFTTLGADRVRADFTQEYSSDRYSDRVSKSIEFRRGDDGGWKIVREYAR